jgi:DNA-binding NarL/FixJ family response regulator
VNPPDPTGDRAPALRVVIVDGCHERRDRLRRHLEDHGLVVCADAIAAGEELDVPRGERPDLCVVVGDTSGDAVAKAVALAADPPAVRVVLMGPAPRDEDLLAAVHTGADGYLSDQLDARLVPALCDVAAGLPAFPARLSTLLVDRVRQGASAATVGAELSDVSGDERSHRSAR